MAAPQIAQQNQTQGGQVTFTGPPPVTVNATDQTTFGTNHSGGTGLVAVGATAQSGVAIHGQTPVVTTLTGSGDEIWAVGGKAFAAPAGTVGTAAASFGCVINSTWNGSVDNSASGLNYGGQFISYIGGTASVLEAIGVEADVVLTGTGTIANAWGVLAHVDTTAAGIITATDVIRISTSNTGGATFTDVNGLHITALSTAATGHNVAIKIDNQNAADFAIKTGTGIVQLGGGFTMGAGSPAVGHAIIPTLDGLITNGDGSAIKGGITINQYSAQSEAFLTCVNNGTTVFQLAHGGGVTIGADWNFGAHNIIITSGTQLLRLQPSTGTVALYNSGTVVWSSTTAAAGANDTSLGRAGVNTLQVGDGGANANGQINAKYVKNTTTTVSGLASASTAGAGARAFVTDATATTFASIVAGSGSNGVPVYSDGTNWRIG